MTTKIKKIGEKKKKKKSRNIDKILLVPGKWLNQKFDLFRFPFIIFFVCIQGNMIIDKIWRQIRQSF